jgi:hypothetical protein
MVDITMSLNDTLELDTIIRESNVPKNPVGPIKYEGSDSTNHNLTGIQTNTAIFDPQESGNYTIPINGQELTIKVTETSTIPETGLTHFYYAETIEDISNDWVDSENQEPLKKNGDPSLTTINSTQAVAYSETSAGGHSSINDAHAFGLNKEYTIAVVLQLNNTDDQVILNNGVPSSPYSGLRFDINNNKWAVDHQGNGLISGGSPTASTNYVAIFTHAGNDGDTILDINGTEKINTTLTSPGDANNRLDSRWTHSYQPKPDQPNGDVIIGASGFEQTFADSTRRDELTRILGDAFDISVNI